MSRIAKEKQMVERMIRFYCRRHHGTELCPECAALIEYAHHRLDRCAFGEQKPSCRQCVVHCYAPKRRAQIREVMRYSGPWILFYRPFLFIKHWLRERFF